MKNKEIQKDNPSGRTSVPSPHRFFPGIAGRSPGSPGSPHRQPRLWTAALAIILVCLASCARVAPPPEPEVRVTPPPEPVPRVEPLPALPRVEDPRLARLDAVIKQEIAAGHTPGAVVLVGHQGKIVYRKAFGSRALTPQVLPLTPDAIFDLASLTKVVATAPAVMQLVDAGRLRLEDPAAKYWPEFGANGKRGITVKQLLTHTSGLRADVKGSGNAGTLAALAGDHPINPPGTSFHYSDANFIALGEIVRRVSGLPLDAYCAQKLFRPLGMRDTRFQPGRAQSSRLVPTDVRWGEVHDPIAYRLGGVAGNAGVFATADDLALYCQMFLENGQLRGRRVLSPAAVAAMIKPYSLPGNATRRGLGWDMLSPYSRVFTAAFPAGSFGHTGYTGTSLWLDPRSRTFLIILTNRLHPNGRGNVKSLRAKAAAAVAAALNLGPAAHAEVGDDPLVMTGHGQSDTPDRVQTGLDVLAASGFAPLTGKNIGLITNHTGRDAAGRTTVELLRRAPGVTLRVLFSPEHGLSGTRDEKIASGRDPATGLAVYSLYGDVKRPTPAMLRGLDALVYDVQDVGVRFYTYITTLAYCLEAAAAHNLEVYVLDRPDPLTAAVVQGPVLEPSLKSFIGYFPLPVRYGLTIGELARLFNREAGIGARLHVVKMQGYRRDQWFDQTGLPWINPSPNLRSLTQAVLYPGVGLIESANVSVGRGTPTPFEILGAPWISGEKLAHYLNRRQIAGVAFAPVAFTPTASRFRGQRCEGVRVRLLDRNVLDSPALGLELAAALLRLYPGKVDFDCALGMIGSREVLRALKSGVDPRDIRRRWQPGLEAFQQQRARYLLY